MITDGVEPSLHIEYKSSHVKQYFKEQRALRTETTINNPKDFYVAKAVSNVSHLRDLGDQVNRKLLEVERVSHQCVLTQDALDRLQQPTVEAGQRASALRFADPRVMALCQAITGFAHLPRLPQPRSPATPRSTPRAPVPAAQMTYDLRRLRLKGLIHRIPKTHRYTATSYGLKVAFFYAKLYLRILRPEWAGLLPVNDQLPRPLRAAMDQLEAQIRRSTRRPLLPPEKLASTVTKLSLAKCLGVAGLAIVAPTPAYARLRGAPAGARRGRPGIEAARSVTQIARARDVVALEHGARLVATELHRDPLGDPPTDEGPDRAPPEIVRVPTGTARRATRGLPTLGEAADRVWVLVTPAAVRDFAKEHVRHNESRLREPGMLGLLRLEPCAQIGGHRERARFVVLRRVGIKHHL